MNRIVCSLLAAGAAALAVASPAHAHPWWEREPSGRPEYRWQRFSGREWRALRHARRHFYARWNSDPWERARFERWYEHRCDELRRRGW